MGIFESIGTCYKKSFKISGCSPRSEYWWFFIFIGAVFYAAVFMSRFAFDYGVDPLKVPVCIFTIILIISIPAIFCVTARRLHDVNRSAAWILPSLIFPVPMLFLVIAFATFPSDPNSVYHSKQKKSREKENQLLPSKDNIKYPTDKDSANVAQKQVFSGNTARYCQYCGHIIKNADTEYCEHCGKSLR